MQVIFTSSTLPTVLLLLPTLVCLPGGLATAQAPQTPAKEAEQTAEDEKKATEKNWKQLDIREGGSWDECRFGGDGPVEFKNGVIKLGFGDPLTGARWEGDFPKMNYEVALEARRTAGFDFFCGLTVPVGEEERCSLILGGWGGSLVGISSIDGMDAANNETMLIRDFEQEQWYKVRMRVTPKRLVVWLDEDEVIDLERDDRPLDIRSEMEETVPVGVAAFQCEAEIRNVRVRRLEEKPAGESGDQ